MIYFNRPYRAAVVLLDGNRTNWHFDTGDAIYADFPQAHAGACCDLALLGGQVLLDVPIAVLSAMPLDMVCVDA